MLVALFLVNLPFAHQTITDAQVARSGREVEATLLKSRTVNGQHLVDYRLPKSIDASSTRYSARVDTPTYEQARETDVLLVRVVPGKPSANRPEGQVGNRLFAVVALTADAVLLLVAMLYLRRWRRWSRHEVMDLDGDEATLESRGQTLTASVSARWTSRVAIGDRVSGSMHLVAESDVLPGLPLSGLERVHGSSYVVRGRVVDARAGRVELEMDDGFRLTVETGEHKIRADIRDSTEVRGTLCFTPTRG